MAAAERTEIVDVNWLKMLKSISNFTEYPKFVSNVKTATLVTSTEEYKRVRFDVELIKSISYVIDIKEFVDQERGMANVTWGLHESTFMSQNNGGWQLKKIDENKTEVTYRLDVDLNFPVPGFIMKNLIKTTLPKTIEEFSKKAKEG